MDTFDEKDFANLPVDGALLTSVEIEPLKRICVRLFTIGEPPTYKDGGKEYDVRFIKVVDFKLDMSFDGAKKIVSHQAFGDSDYLAAVKSKPTRYSGKFNYERLRHFQLICVNGKLDVISESFSCELIWET